MPPGSIAAAGDGLIDVTAVVTATEPVEVAPAPATETAPQPEGVLR